jgi:hypothetical protein
MNRGVLRTNKTRYLVLAFAGFLLLAIIASRLIGPANAMKGRGTAPLPIASLGDRPVLQIELAWKEAQLEQIFLGGDKKANFHDASVGNTLDTLLFIPAYAGALITLGLMICRATKLRGPVPYLILLLVPAIACCDWSENWGVSNTIHHMETQGKPDAGDAVRISTPSLIKWALTALVLAALGIEAFYTGSAKWWPVTVISAFIATWIGAVLSCYAKERWG